jgi:transposase InsO family protein
LERARAIHELRPSQRLSLLLEAAGMARSTFYYHLHNSMQPDKYAREKEMIKSLDHEHKGRYGYRRITAEMKKRGYAVNHKTVLKLMRICGIKCRVRLRKYRSYRGDAGKATPNIIDRNFTAGRPNQKWATDVTEFSLFGTKLYLSPVIDLYNREIISYDISERPTFHQVINMLEKAFERIPDNSNLILHSDQGWPIQDVAFPVKAVAKRGHTEHVAQRKLS